MRAVVYYGPNKVEITDVPEPNPGEGQVKVKVGFNGICGTDLHEYYAGPIFIPTSPHPLTGQEMPLVLGHEFSGTVTELGKGVTGIAVGDRVAIEPLYRCGHCGPCRAGNYNICAQIGFHGLMSDGGMAEYTVVPTDMIHALPDNVSLELGAGPIGIGLWFALRGKGLGNVYVVEPSPTRRASIEALGAKTLDPTAVDVPAFIADLTDGNGADAIYDAAGVQPAVETALGCIGARKPLVSVAIYEKPLTTPLQKLVMNESRIQGSLCYTSADYEAVIDLMSQGHYDTTGWVDKITLDGVIDDGFEALHAGTKMKVLVDPSTGASA